MADHDLTLAGVEFLISEPAQTALSWLAGEDLSPEQHLRLISSLREIFSLQESGWLLDQARLRQKAVEKFEHAEFCLFLDEALQQASSLALSGYHVQQLIGFSPVADLGAGIGADSIALAKAGCQVMAVELDPIRAKLLEHNVKVSSVERQVEILQTDWTMVKFKVNAAFIDPARRTAGKRVFTLDTMVPPISAILELQQQVPNLLVKVAPGIDHVEVPRDTEVEFVSLNGEMKEALLRFGALRRGLARCATLLPSGVQLTAETAADPDLAIGEARRFLLEPDPAVIRAGLVRPLGQLLHASMLNADIAYLTADESVETPFARGWQVLRQGGFHLKTLNQWLRELEAGEVVIKKRGSPIEPDSFQKRLKTAPGGRKLTVFFTMCQERPWMVLGEEVSP
ncbi:MAG: class I SAM-dependent methyltransferase [Anaerolineae bacterium]|jgi:hypothetical protein|nr:class I SAM-dependent methyltransferase [Anaerolineae bacterium]